MKKLILSIVFTFVISGLQSQGEKTTKTDTFKVSGICGMCEKRIEKAASEIKGVVKADWDAVEGIMILAYNPGETTIETVQKAIAAVGYDTEKVRADDKVYAELPRCCQYERKKT